MNRPREALIDLLLEPGRGAGLSPQDWTAVIAAARAANLLGSLGEALAQAGATTRCGADRHLAGARQLSERQRRSVRWEAQCIHDALSSLKTPVVLLKGAAYALGGYRNALGRLFGDVDILVSPDVLGAVEVGLMMNGWTSQATDLYDQRYYRQWMHELPPMVHVRRGAVIDVHHTILPRTSRFAPDPRAIIARAKPLPGMPWLRVPGREDLVIHSIVHLVHEGELHNGLRDLHDIHLLIEAEAGNPAFFASLLDCTREHGVEAPVALGLRLVRRYFRTPVPESVLGALDRSPGSRSFRAALDVLYDQALGPQPDPPGLATSCAGFALYVRAHWLRMPPLLLARHLSRKAWGRVVGGKPTRPATQEPLAGEP